MLFSSIVFLFYFFPAVLTLYYLFRRWVPVKNGILLAASFFFYAWGEPGFVWLMLFSVGVNYLLALMTDCFRGSIAAKWFLFLAAVWNMGLLYVFKYLDFFIRNLAAATGTNLRVTNLALPIGISFFSFQALSYVAEVYRGRSRVQKNPFYVALYIVFFPQMIAGPIVRYSVFEGQLRDRKETLDKFSVGVCRFIAGLGKKVLLADNFAVVADRIFDGYGQRGMPAALAWVGAAAFTMQIFFDFSGYSDMAVGLGLMFGFKFEENFNYPYIARSVGEFWRRWHISLSVWFKEYVYFPLGGSKVRNMDLVIRNIMVVWLCTGLWHGAEWTFVIWGMLNFLFLVLERFVGLERKAGYGVLRWCYTMFVVNLGWVIFRSENLVSAGNYIRCMFGLGGNGFFSDYAWMYVREYGIFFVIGAFLCVPVGRRCNYLMLNDIMLKGKISRALVNVFYPAMMMGVFLLCITYLVKGGYHPFIYFNF